jgi:hypothetical protein
MDLPAYNRVDKRCANKAIVSLKISLSRFIHGGNENFLEPEKPCKQIKPEPLSCISCIEGPGREWKINGNLF